MHRWTVKDVSLDEVSVHDSPTVLEDVAVAASAVGAEGGGDGSVPSAPKTSTWKVPAPVKLSTRSVHVPAAALGTPIVSKRPGAAQLPLLASSTQRLTATWAPVGSRRRMSRSGDHS